MRQSVIFIVLVAALCATDARAAGTLPKKRVAIVGGGVGGSATAQFLFAAEPAEYTVETHVYEAAEADNHCGRVATVSLAQGSIQLEAGASVVHERNKYIGQLAAMLGLPRTTGPYGSGATMAVYSNSSHSLVLQTTGSKIRDTAVMLWRYGYSLLRLNWAVDDLLERFDRIYELQDQGKHFHSPQELFGAVDLWNHTQRSLSDLLVNEMDLNKNLLSELITGVTRVNYGQNLSINALAGMVSLAGGSTRLWSVRGGNAQLCSGLLSISHAKVHDRDKVTSVKKTADGFLVTSSNGEAKLYDAVVLALPLDHSDIQLEPAARAKIVNRKLQRTHATFVIGQPKLEFFGVRGPQPAGEPDESCPLPDLVLTKDDTEAFSSMGKVHDDPQNRGGCFGVYKIFSRAAVPNSLLAQMFNSFDPDVVTYDWQAYPAFAPPERFSPFTLEPGLYYNSAVESAASALEMSAVAARNNALAVLDYLKQQVLHGNRPDTAAGAGETLPKQSAASAASSSNSATPHAAHADHHGDHHHPPPYEPPTTHLHDDELRPPHVKKERPPVHNHQDL